MKKHLATKALCLLLALVMVLAVCPVTARAAQTANSCIADLIGYYKSYQESAETDILRTLEDLAKIDAKQAEAWTQIMNYWSHVNTDMVVNIGTVPEGLPEDNSVAIVILGFALNADGTMKDELIGRLQTGLAIAENYPNSYVVVTGGGTAANNPNVTEGGLMGEWLLEQGLAEDRLIIENKAPNTVGNAENTYKILAEEYPEVESLVMVTSDYHVPRGCILFYSKCLLAAYATGGEPLEMISNAGYYTGSNGYESISLQASGVASVAGVSASSSVKLSKLTRLYLTFDGETVSVAAGYDSDYRRDVTAKAVIEGFDPALGAEQTVTVSYTENGITLSGGFDLSKGETVIFSTDYLSNLIAEAEAISPATYTRDSYAVLVAAIEAAKAVLEQEDASLEAVDAAYAALQSAIDGLMLLANIAYKMPVTANCNQDNAKKVNDGTISTSNYWASQVGSTNVPANEAELIIDLDGTYDLEAIRVYPYWGGQRIYQYELFGSVDGENWEKIAENVSDDYATDAGFTHEVDATAAYVKLVGIKTHVEGRADINNIHIVEMQVFGTEPANIAYGKPTRSSGSDQSVSSSSGALETKSIDGDRSTYWDAGKYANQPWIVIDLQGLYKLDELNVITYWMRTDNRYYHYDLYASTDGETFEKIGAKDWDTPETVLGETFDLREQEVYATHIKLVGLYDSANSSFHVNEIRAYGTEVESLPHEHSYEAVVTAPTCTEGGYTTYTCACGESYVADETPALGHDWDGTSCTRCDATRENPFQDIPEESYYINPVLWAFENGITSGTAEGAFNPNGELLRCQFVTMLWRAAGSPEPSSTVNPFEDVKEGDYFYKAVLWAVEQNVTAGVSNTVFGSYLPTTRAQVVTFLWSYAGSPAVDSANPFTDVAAGAWYESAVVWAVENGITSGMGDGTFGVNNICNRAQAVTFLHSVFAE